MPGYDSRVMKIWSASPFSLPLVAGILLTLSIATAEGFSIQGAYKYNFDGSMVLQGEGGYSDIVYPGIEVGARLALDLNPLGEASTILLYGFGEYSKTIEETEEASSSAFAKAVLGLGYINSNTLNTLCCCVYNHRKLHAFDHFLRYRCSRQRLDPMRKHHHHRCRMSPFYHRHDPFFDNF